MRRPHGYGRRDTGAFVARFGVGIALSTTALTLSPDVARAAAAPAVAVAKAPKVFDVKKDFGAKGDGTTDDGPAIQKALDAASAAPYGGKVFIPAGTYFIDTTLLLGDRTEVYGEKKDTVLMRGNRYVLRPTYEPLDPAKVATTEAKAQCKNVTYSPETDQDTQCKSTVSCTGIASKELFSNRHYNCGNHKIRLHDFTIDGSKITVSAEKKLPIYGLDGKLAYEGANPVANMGTISLSATKDLLIDSLTIRNVPQDAIFIRNGGVNTIIRRNLIDGHNTLWFNGGGINIEVHPTGHFHTTIHAPVVINDNTINVTGPNFCYGTTTAACTSDAQCANFPYDPSSANASFCNKGSGEKCPGFCGVTPVARASNTVGISTGKRTLDYGGFGFVPYSHIHDNTIRLTNRHIGIACTACKNAIIRGNGLFPYEAAAGSADNGFSGRFTGISATGDNEDMFVGSNGIVGAGKPEDGRAVYLDGKGKLIMTDNTISNRDTSGGPSKPVGFATVRIAGFDGLTLSGNKLTDIKHSVPLEIGTPKVCTKNGSVVGNTLSTDKAITPLYTRCIANIVGVTPGVDLDKNTLSLSKAYAYPCEPQVVCK